METVGKGNKGTFIKPPPVLMNTTAELTEPRENAATEEYLSSSEKICKQE